MQIRTSIFVVTMWSFLVSLSVSAQTNVPLWQVSCAQDVIGLFPKTADDLQQLAARATDDAHRRVTDIIAISDNERTFENTVQAVDRLISLSDFAIYNNICESLTHTSPDASVREAASAGRITVQEFFNNTIYNNVELYNALKSYCNGAGTTEKLSDQQRYFLDTTMRLFIRNGVNLPDDTRKKVLQVQSELAHLEEEFSANIATSNVSIEATYDELQGLDKDLIASFAVNERGLYVVPASRPIMTNLLENCSVAATRKRMYLAYDNRAYPANEHVLQQMIAKRDTLANLLGFASFAHLNLDDSMAQTPERADEFLHSIRVKTEPVIDAAFAALKKDLPPSVQLTSQGQLQPWDLEYVKNAYKKNHFLIDEQAIAEYFSMQASVDGLLDIYRHFFSIDFKKVPSQGLWHEDAQLIEVIEQSTRKVLGYLILDLYPRENKYTHACKIGVIPALRLPDGNNRPSVALVIANLPKSLPNKPSLLQRDGLRTFFHEFGHALHHFFSITQMGSASNCMLDFVEMPSQLLEEWLWDAAMLKKISRHYKTGDSLPDNVLARIEALKQFNSIHWVVRHFLLAPVALAYFAPGADKDPQAIYGTMYQQAYKHVAYEPQAHFYAAFIHLPGYGARYYSYLWSKVYALDLFSEIKKHGLLNPEIGHKYVREVLSKGGSQDPNELLKNFLGREPNADAFFADLGI